MIKKIVLMLLVSSLVLPTIQAKEVLPTPQLITTNAPLETDISGKWELFLDETLDGQIEGAIQTIFSDCTLIISFDKESSTFSGTFGNCEASDYVISGAVYNSIFNAIQYNENGSDRDYLTYSGVIDETGVIRGTYHTAAGSGDFEWRRKGGRLGEQVKKHSQPAARLNSLADTPSNIHIVEQGDTLFSLSRQYGVSLDDLMEWNGKSTEDTLIKIGDKLIVGAE